MKEYFYEKIRDKYYPLVPAILFNQEKKVDLFALVDSGSMISLFQTGVARRLGIVVKTGVPKYIDGVGGKIFAYIHKIPIKVADKEFDCLIAFFEEYKASFNILARKDFFEKFRIIFEEKKGKLILEDA